MKKHKKSLLLMALLLLVVFTAVYIGLTYSKYTAEVSGNGSTKVAKWAFGTDNSIGTINVTLDGTVDASTLVNGRIAPGTSGSFNIALVNTNSEVGTDFTVAISTIENKPTNLKFYKDNSYSAEIIPGTTNVTGQLAAGDSTGVTVPIYWKWAYETTNGDTADTTDGTAGNSLTIPVKVTGVQTEPGAAITSHINNN